MWKKIKSVLLWIGGAVIVGIVGLLGFRSVFKSGGKGLGAFGFGRGVGRADGGSEVDDSAEQEAEDTLARVRDDDRKLAGEKEERSRKQSAIDKEVAGVVSRQNKRVRSSDKADEDS